MRGVAIPVIAEDSTLAAVDVSWSNPPLCLPSGTELPLLMATFLLEYLFACTRSWIICSSMVLKKRKRKQLSTAITHCVVYD